jgi:hypothetical protein
MTRGRKAVTRGRIAVARMRQRFRWENSGDRTRKEVDSDDRVDNSCERRETLMTRWRKAVARGRIAVTVMRQR